MYSLSLSSHCKARHDSERRMGPVQARCARTFPRRRPRTESTKISTKFHRSSPRTSPRSTSSSALVVVGTSTGGRQLEETLAGRLKHSDRHGCSHGWRRRSVERHRRSAPGTRTCRVPDLARANVHGPRRDVRNGAQGSAEQAPVARPGLLFSFSSAQPPRLMLRFLRSKQRQRSSTRSRRLPASLRTRLPAMATLSRVSATLRSANCSTTSSSLSLRTTKPPSRSGDGTATSRLSPRH